MGTGEVAGGTSTSGEPKGTTNAYTSGTLHYALSGAYVIESRQEIGKATELAFMELGSRYVLYACAYMDELSNFMSEARLLVAIPFLEPCHGQWH